MSYDSPAAVPKNRNGLTGIRKAEARHESILGKLMLAASKVADQEAVTGHKHSFLCCLYCFFWH